LLLVFGLSVNALDAESISFKGLVVYETVDSLIEYFLIAEDTLIGLDWEINDLFHELVFVESLFI